MLLVGLSPAQSNWITSVNRNSEKYPEQIDCFYGPVALWHSSLQVSLQGNVILYFSTRAAASSYHSISWTESEGLGAVEGAVSIAITSIQESFIIMCNGLTSVRRFHARLEQYSCALHKSQKQNQILQKEREGDTAARVELQQKYAEKSRSVSLLPFLSRTELLWQKKTIPPLFLRQKRKLEEMYEALRGEFESLKQNQQSQRRNGRPAIMPSSHSFDVAGVRGNYNDMTFSFKGT